MVGGYFHNKMVEIPATFDLFVRKLPPNREYLIAAGLEQAIEYLQQFQYEPAQIEYILKQPMFDKFEEKEPFAKYLEKLRFSGTLRAVPEGTLIFPEEPIIEITAPLGEAQLIETAMLSIIGHQTMIATKASKVVQSAAGKPVIDFGARRSHGIYAGIYGSRACYIGGTIATSNVFAGNKWGIPVSGTQAHSWIQTFPTEFEAFKHYCETYKEGAILLIDTYNLEQGVKNVSELNKILKREGKQPIFGVRIDSGDLLKSAKNVRSWLDERGEKEIKIIVSSDLNEDRIEHLIAHHAPIDAFGVGTEMMVSKDDAALSTVYKLVEFNGQPKIKFSPGKESNPGQKQIFRQLNMDGSIIDILGTPFDYFEDTHALLQPYLYGIKLEQDLPSLNQIQQYTKRNLVKFKKFSKFIVSPMILHQITLCHERYRE
jgi:nicotinate phosphoribosyltransferase